MQHYYDYLRKKDYNKLLLVMFHQCDMNGELRKNGLHKCILVSLINATWMQKHKCENWGKDGLHKFVLHLLNVTNANEYKNN